MFSGAHPQQQYQQQCQYQQQHPTYQNCPDNMLGPGGIQGGGWATMCEQAPQPTSRPYQSADQQQAAYGGDSAAAADMPQQQQTVLNVAKVSRNNESQKTPRRAVDATLNHQHNHQQHLQNLQAQLGAGSACSSGTGGALPMHSDVSTEGLILPEPSNLSEGGRMQGGYLSARQQGAGPASARGGAAQPSVAEQYQHQARYVPPPPQQYPKSARLPASVTMFAGQQGQQVQLQQAQQQTQQQVPGSGRSFMQRLPQFLGGSSGGGGAGGSRPAPVSARAGPVPGSARAAPAPAPASASAAPASARQPVNPYLQMLPFATARPHYPGQQHQANAPAASTGRGCNLPPLQAAPSSARGTAAPGTARASVHVSYSSQQWQQVQGSGSGQVQLSSGSDVYARLSQGLPSVETARSARLLAARGQPLPAPQQQQQKQSQREHAFAEAVQAPLPEQAAQVMQGARAAAVAAGSPRTRLPAAGPPHQQHARWQQRLPSASISAGISGERLLPLDSPGGSTGLTPRAAGMMRPSLASPRYAAAARQAQMPLQKGLEQQQQQQSSDAGHLYTVPSTESASYAPQAMHTQHHQQQHQAYAYYAAVPAPQQQAHDYSAAMQQQQQQQQVQQQQQQSSWHFPQQQYCTEAVGDQGFKAHSFQAASLAGMGNGVYEKADHSLQDSGPMEQDAIKAVRCQSQQHLPPYQPHSAQPAQQQQQQFAAPGLLSSYSSMPAAALGQQQQLQQLEGGVFWAPQADHAAPGGSYGLQAGSTGSFSQPHPYAPQQQQQQQHVQQQQHYQQQQQQQHYHPYQQQPLAVEPLLPGLPFIEHQYAPPAASAGMEANPPPAPQPHQPPLQSPFKGSGMDCVVSAVAEEVAEYDMHRQQELEQQQQAAAVAAAARRVSQVAEQHSSGAHLAPVAATPAAIEAAMQPARGGSSRSSRLPSPPVGTLGRASASPEHQRPVSAARALQQWGHLLTPFEQSEILSFQSVWFVGKPGTPKIRGDKSSPEPNHGYDDQRGDYLSIVGDQIGYRFEVVSVLGRGSFGQVLRCIDHRTGQPVALKMIRSKRRFQKQAAIEAAILALLREKDPDDSVNIVRTYDTFTFRNHLCITFELLSINLYEYIKACSFQGSSLSVIRRVAQQVLVTLRFLLRLNVVHCDLKPENILLRERGKTAVKVIDFGSSCYVDQRMYTYIQSRFYRSPEVILGLPYGPPIDMWSLGCILAELLTGQPIFPGEDEREQLACIMEVLGAPPRTLLEQAPRANLFFDTATWAPLACPPNSRGKTHRPSSRTLERALGSCDDPHFIDFLQRCLVWEPEQRMAPDEALQHPWIAGSALAPTPVQLSSGTSSAASTWRSAPLPAHAGAGGSSNSQESGGGGGLAAMAGGLLTGTARVAAGFL